MIEVWVVVVNGFVVVIIGLVVVVSGDVVVSWPQETERNQAGQRFYVPLNLLLLDYCIGRKRSLCTLRYTYMDFFV